MLSVALLAVVIVTNRGTNSAPFLIGKGLLLVAMIVLARGLAWR